MKRQNLPEKGDLWRNIWAASEITKATDPLGVQAVLETVFILNCVTTTDLKYWLVTFSNVKQEPHKCGFLCCQSKVIPVFQNPNELSRDTQSWRNWHLCIASVFSHFNFNSKYHGKCKFASKFIHLENIFNLM